jgi:excisionase family DNA binding protein
MVHISDVISFTAAAKVKKCGRNTLYRAANDGRLNAVEVSGRQMLVRDQKWEEFEPKVIGHRARKLADIPEDR